MRWQHYLHQFWQNAEPLLPGSFASLVIIGLLKLGTWQPLELLSYSTLFRLRGAIPWDDRVVVVAIDEPSLKTLGRFPWSRQRYTELLKVLTQAEASTVVLDILLSEPSPDDPALAAAMVQQGRVVLAQAWDSMGSPLLSNSVLREAAANHGHIYQQYDRDGLTRRIEPQMQDIPALGLATTQVYSLVREAVPEPDRRQPLWINWPGSASTAPTYSFADVLQQKVAVEKLRDKIVVVGITAIGFDPLQTPFDQSPPTTNVYLHAALINNLLRQNFLQILPESWLLSGLALLGSLFSLALFRWQLERQLVALAGLCAGWSVASLLLFHWGYWIPVASPIALLVSTTATVALHKHFKAGFRLQQEIDRLWQAYRDDLVVQGVQNKAMPNRAVQNALIEVLPLPQMAKLAALAEQLGRSQSAQAAVARSLSIGLVAADIEGLIWFCNFTATAHLQVQVGDRLHQLIPKWLSQTQLQQAQWPLPSVALNSESLEGESLSENSPASWEIQQGDRWFELKFEPLSYRAHLANPPDPTGQLDGLLLVLEDISDRKQVEQNLQQQMQELQQLSQLKDDFLSTVSHELRTPVTNMRMAIRMLQLSASEDRRTRYLQILEDECTREIDLINDLLDLQRLEAGAKIPALEVIHLQEWLPQFMESFQERAKSRQQTLQLQMAPNLSPLFSDSNSLERILAEMINNACKYTPPEGEIEICVEAVHSVPAYIMFQISNSGSEIPGAELDRIFDKFYRISSGDRWNQGGTGLGLALVKKLVEYLGGTIAATSQLGQTIFTIKVPIDPAPTDPAPADPAPTGNISVG
ncbi:MAG: CHASE2 domain-containing protein [Drouetiella hepatica Uher 2000/2452]|jgi:signal transduction histidine kinase|uniref:histidine kinase n=1 Tax=Drouetiella hepatica Uher 2000/2452 TaxID=904376 RepID=A0A951ULB8_9CYAN|nr:CHASE2 domain-containing protein [Drouetiella hepatica Uher 2000/2452]